MVDMLIKKGGDVNSGNRDGITPLHIAAEKSHLDVLEMLLKVGAQVGRYLCSTHTRYKCCHNKVFKHCRWTQQTILAKRRYTAVHMLVTCKVARC
jgi:hypothetical protein